MCLMINNYLTIPYHWTNKMNMKMEKTREFYENIFILRAGPQNNRAFLLISLVLPDRLW